jgi:hypothetical protein
MKNTLRFAKMQLRFLLLKRWLWGSMLIVFLLSLLVTQAFANPVPYYGFNGGSHAFGRLISYQAGGGTTGVCGIRSYMEPASTINVIGWTWYQCRRYLNGTVVEFGTTFGPSAITGSSNQVTSEWVGAFNSQGIRLMVHGVHDFNHHTVSQPWRPYHVYFSP